MEVDATIQHEGAVKILISTQVDARERAGRHLELRRRTGLGPSGGEPRSDVGPRPRKGAAVAARTGARAGELARRHPRALFVTRPARKEWISKREVRRVARVSSNPVIELVITH